MVGLTELGEFAWDVEKIHNRLLEEERPVTAAVLRMIGTAETTFRGWVEALNAERRVTPDPRALHAAIRGVEAELPGHESVLPAPARPPSPRSRWSRRPSPARPWPPTSRSTSTSSTRCSTRLRSQPPRRTCSRQRDPPRHAVPAADPFAFAELGMPGSGTSVEVEILDVRRSARGRRRRRSSLRRSTRRAGDDRPAGDRGRRAAGGRRAARAGTDAQAGRRQHARRRADAAGGAAGVRRRHRRGLRGVGRRGGRRRRAACSGRRRDAHRRGRAVDVAVAHPRGRGRAAPRHARPRARAAAVRPAGGALAPR